MVKSPFEFQFNLAQVIFILLIIAAICNGSAFWLKRVGWVEPQMYQIYTDFLGSDPDYHRTPVENEQLRVLSSQLYASEGVEVLLKAAKDVWLLLFIVVSFTLIVRHKTRVFSFPPWPLLFFLLLVALSAIYSAWKFGLLMPLAGLRFFSFLVVAVLATWIVQQRYLSLLLHGLMILMAVQLLLAPVELMYGLHMFGAKLFGFAAGDRIVGTMLQPSSLGITAVLTLVFYLVFAENKCWFIPMALMTLILVFLSASAMAILLLTIVAIVCSYQHVSTQYQSWFRIGAITGITLIVLLLPEISGRWNIMDSLWGRLLIVEQYLEQHSLLTLLFGQGLGVGTNTAANLLMNWQANQAPGYAITTIFIADATPMALIAQIGVIGLLSFYLLLIYAAMQDRQVSPFYLIVAIASLTTNLTELFPVNMVLGIVMARSLFLKGSHRNHDQISS